MEKKNLFRLVFEKWFCHHQFLTIERIEFKNEKDKLMEITVLRECKICGRSKTNKI